MTDSDRLSISQPSSFFRLLPLVLLLGLLVSAPTHAEKLAIGFAEFDFYPYGKPSEEEIYVGYLRALLDAFAKEQGHELEFAVTPLKRLFQEFERGEIDLFIPDNPNWSRQDKEGIVLYYSHTIAVALDGFAVVPGREGETVGAEMEHIGVILGFTVEPLFDTAELEQLEFHRASNFESIFRALFLERVDAVYCNLAAANHVLSRMERMPSSVVWNAQLPQFKSEFKVSSTRPELIEEFNGWLHSHGEIVLGLKEEFGIWEGEGLPWGEN